MREILRRAAAGEALNPAEQEALLALAECMSGDADPNVPQVSRPEPAHTPLAAEATYVEEPADASGPSTLPPEAPTANGVHGLRFAHRGTLGAGGMGEVLRVYDPVLKREVALKIGHARLVVDPGLRQRFLEEAQVQAQLQHPNLVPVHELGVLEDGRPWFTMDLIRGAALSSVVQRVHEASVDDWEVEPGGWSLRRLVTVFAQACRAVGYAHGRGVLHRDLKPANLMIGAFGEVRVVDWGLAKVRAAPTPHDKGAARGKTLTGVDLIDASHGESVVTARSSELTHVTLVGSVSGTPAYMAPEQALGQNDAIDARTDVYALGAVLYEILAGHPPYARAPRETQLTPKGVVDAVRRGPPPVLTEVARLRVPEDLAEIVARAMARAQAERFPDADVMAAAVEAWLDGARRKAQAAAMLVQAGEAVPVAAALRAEARVLSGEAAGLLAAIPRWAPSESKAAAWEREDRAEVLDREAVLADARRMIDLHGALSHAPEDPDVHAALAEVYRTSLRAAEARTDGPAAATAELQLRTHVGQLPLQHPVRVALQAWLDAEEEIALDVVPGDVSGTVHAETTQLRRSVAGPAQPLPAPEDGAQRTVRLARGSWRVVLDAPGLPPVVLPFQVTRDGSPRREAGTTPGVRLPPPGSLADGEVFVAAGWFRAGGDARAPGTPLGARRVWVDSFVAQRFPVTHGAYLAFLDDLVARGDEAQALRHAPRLLAPGTPDQGALLYDYVDGRFRLRPSDDADAWADDMPVTMVSWFGASAYAAWWAARTGQPWRLLDELEWEKGARGVDGRIHPWGDAFDPSWCCMRDSHAKARLASVHAFPDDVSVYGLRGMAGNVLDWTCSTFVTDGHAQDLARHVIVENDDPSPRRVVRGGSWNDAASSTRCATRYNLDPTIRLNFVGFRLARSPFDGA